MNYRNDLNAMRKQSKKILLLFFIVPLFCFSQQGNADGLSSSSSSSVTNIIPKPVSVQLSENKPVELNSKTIIVAGKKFSEQAEYLRQQIKDQCGLDLSIQNAPAKKSSIIILEQSNKKVDHPEPVPAQISAKGLSNQVLGAQANVWTEYMAYPSKVEYMIFPRMTALSEVLWTDKNKKDIADFKRRLQVTAVPRYEFWNNGYYKDFNRASK